MVKIIGRHSLGEQPVYDIGVVQDHNFVIKNGYVASNCFNKSHTVAYAYVTYQTAYLKANYPVEYMAALLTTSSGNYDKIQKYIATATKMGLEVLGPDINRSNIDFTPINGKILFGLSAIRNVGEGVIDCILKARADRGEFTSLVDFCLRIDLHTANSRTMESLVKSGALDQINGNRKQSIEYLNLLVPWAQKKAKEKASGQGNLFNLVNDTETDEVSLGDAPDAPNVSDFTQQEKLQFEKELLGFYVSDHPLKVAVQRCKLENGITLDQLSEQKSRSKPAMIVMISTIKNHVTKKGDRMAFIQIEDLTGSCEALVFPKVYEEVKAYLSENAIVEITGKVDQKDESYQVMIETLKPVVIPSDDKENPAIQNNPENDDLYQDLENYTIKHIAPTFPAIPSESQQFNSVERISSIPAPLSTKSHEIVKHCHSIIRLQMSLEQAENQDKLRQLQALLKEQSGYGGDAKIPVEILISASPYQSLVELGKDYWVQSAKEAEESLKSAGFIVELRDTSSQKGD